MSKVFVLLWMLFSHVIDDYCLQGFSLSSLKQRSFWEETSPDAMYRYDYVVALLMHAISWSFMIMLPCAYYLGFDFEIEAAMVFSLNVIVHAVTDDAKANRGKINLVVDQAVHMTQIMLTYWCFIGGVV